MSLQITIASIPDQSFTATLGGVTYGLRLFLAANVMCCDLTINNEVILSGMRLVSGSPIIPYEYLQNGNFFLITLNDEIPFYDQFNATQFLIYYTQAEIGILANPTQAQFEALTGE